MSLDALKQMLGPGGYIDDPADMAPYLTEWRDRGHGDTPLVARPRDTYQVADVVAHCARNGLKLVPQGGHTGLCGGAMPRPGAGEIVLSLGRLNRVRGVDPQGYIMTVEAGCTLAAKKPITDRACASLIGSVGHMPKRLPRKGMIAVFSVSGAPSSSSNAGTRPSGWIFL